MTPAPSALMRRWQQLAAAAAVALQAAAVAAAGDVPTPADSTHVRKPADPMIFEVNDHKVLNPITSGRWQLSGPLEVRFTRPRSNRMKTRGSLLFGPGVEATRRALLARGHAG